MTKEKVIVRFPPSPTGLFHVGSTRTALYNYLFAKRNGGEFVLRIEDTDKDRSKKEHEEDILNSLEWLGLHHDNKEIWRQSERTEVYKKYLDKLLKSGAAYISKEEEGQNKEVIRFKNPCVKIVFEDLIRGKIEIDTSDLGDFVIAKNLEEPLYHLVVVVDDMETGVTHVIRGEDGISNTPRQILILEALGGTKPTYAHLPLVLDTDKSKLSKRKRGEAVSIRYYRNKGYEPEAIINFMALIGWNPGGEKEIFSLEELVQIFDLEKVQKKGGVFNVEKLDWINREWILKQSKEIQFSRFKSQIEKTKFSHSPKLEDENFLEKLFKIMLDRIHRWGEVSEILEAGEFDYLFQDPVLEKDKILWKGQGTEEARENLERVLEVLDSKDKIMKYAEEKGKGNVLWPLRYALSGKEKSPDPITLLDILSPTESAARVKAAIKLLS